MSSARQELRWIDALSRLVAKGATSEVSARGENSVQKTADQDVDEREQHRRHPLEDGQGPRCYRTALLRRRLRDL